MKNNLELWWLTQRSKFSMSRIGAAYWKVRSYFINQQAWLTKEVPRTFCDKVELIPRVLFAALVDFVEKENGLNQLEIDWEEERKHSFISQEYIDEVIQIHTELLCVYLYIKTIRPKLQKDLDKSYPEFGAKGTKGTYEELYKLTNNLQKQLNDYDMDAMLTIVKYHKSLWT